MTAVIGSAFLAGVFAGLLVAWEIAARLASAMGNGTAKPPEAVEGEAA